MQDMLLFRHCLFIPILLHWQFSGYYNKRPMITPPTCGSSNKTQMWKKVLYFAEKSFVIWAEPYSRSSAEQFVRTVRPNRTFGRSLLLGAIIHMLYVHIFNHNSDYQYNITKMQPVLLEKQVWLLLESSYQLPEKIERTLIISLTHLHFLLLEEDYSVFGASIRHTITTEKKYVKKMNFSTKW